jgi:putative Holliday junction resolvase
VTGRVLAVDPGDVRLGLAVSDELGMIARPLLTIGHTSGEQDARLIVAQAKSLEVTTIVVGVALNHEGRPTPQSEKSMRLIERLRGLTDVPVVPRDESGTTQRAQQLTRKDEALDELAAAVLLQEYLDDQPT